jgi:CRISPR/Cas system-associated exonuclease Cas4 (RecB family)
VLWFPRANETLSIDWDEEKEKESVNEIIKTVERIKKENVFPPNNTNAFFCNNLCSVRKHCEYRP